MAHNLTCRAETDAIDAPGTTNACTPPTQQAATATAVFIVAILCLGMYRGVRERRAEGHSGSDP